jgi:hypothetical protein
MTSTTAPAPKPIRVGCTVTWRGGNAAKVVSIHGDHAVAIRWADGSKSIVAPETLVRV